MKTLLKVKINIRIKRKNEDANYLIILWNEEIDLVAKEIWENGEEICPEDSYYNS